MSELFELAFSPLTFWMTVLSGGAPHQTERRALAPQAGIVIEITERHRTRMRNKILRRRARGY